MGICGAFVPIVQKFLTKIKKHFYKFENPIRRFIGRIFRIFSLPFSMAAEGC